MIPFLGRRSSALLAQRHHRTLTTRSSSFRTLSLPHQPQTAAATTAAPAPVPRRRSVHASSGLLSDVRPSDNRFRKKQTGFEELIGRNNRGSGGRSRNNGKRSNDAKVANNTSFPAGSATHEDEWMDDVDEGVGGGGILPALEERNANIMNEYDFGDTNESELQEWHGRKEEEFHRLSSETEALIESFVGEDAPAAPEGGAVLSQMRAWNSFLSSVASETHSLSDFRRENPQYPPSDFLSSIAHDAAENVDRLSDLLLDSNAASPTGGKKKKKKSSGTKTTPETEVTAYSLAMEAWSLVPHARSGDRCEEILERYGERFGGDVIHAPSVDAYKTVLRAHVMSCSSRRPNDGLGGRSPGEKALGVSNLLASVHAAGDMYLKPDVELRSHAIAAVRNTLLDWQSRRKFRDEGDLSLERSLAGALLDSLGEMETSLQEARGEKEEEGIRLSLRQWHCAIRAYSDALATVARIAIADDENIAEQLLTKLEQLISTNSDNIVLSVVNAGMDDADTQYLLSEIQRNLEEAYTNALSARLILSKEREKGCFDSFDAALDSAISSEVIFQGMRSRSQDSPPDMRYLFPAPTPANYQALVECWCECVRKRYSTPEANAAMANLEELPHLKADNLLKQLEIEQAARPIDGSIYANVIWAWGQVLNWPAIYRQNQYYFAANAVDELLKKTMYRYENGSVYFSWNGTVTKMYNFIFRLNSKIFKGGEGATKRSLNLLDQMEHWRRRSEGAIAQPDAFTFGLILKTISNSGARSSAATAEEMLHRMEDCGVKPREKHYLGVIRAHSRVGQMEVADPRKAEAILQRVKEIYKANRSVKPTVAMYTACISAYGGSKKYNSISKVLELFEEVKELYKESGDENFRPDGMLYGAVLGAITKAKSKDASTIRQAFQLLDAMETSHDVGDIETGPNRYAYTNLLHAISQSRIADGASMAENLVLRMTNRSRELNDDSICPDTHTYTSLIQTFAGSGRSDAVQRAQKCFKQMENQYKNGDSGSKPNKVTYTALINCWRRSDREDAGEEAGKILSMMEAKGKDGDLDLKPDAFVYASVIDTWARCKSRDKAVQVWDIYQRMKMQYSEGNMESKPNNVIMTSIIKACGYTRGGREDKQKALKVLLGCMAELKTEKYIIPTPLTYRASLNAAKALVTDDVRRRPISATIFETCCRKGQCDNTVLEALEKVQPELYVKLPGEIPSTWKQNVLKDRTRF